MYIKLASEEGQIDFSNVIFQNHLRSKPTLHCLLCKNGAEPLNSLSLSKFNLCQWGVQETGDLLLGSSVILFAIPFSVLGFYGAQFLQHE